MLRFLTAGESHGPVLTAILEGMPAGLPLTSDDINHELRRRQEGYGSGGRMNIEQDTVQITSGIAAGKTTGAPIALVHHAGWDRGSPLADALAADRRRDRRYRATQLGPHRGDVVVQVAGRAAKDHVSRGQQKLVAAGLMLAQLEIQERERPGRSALLLDDPAAELDSESLARLLTLVRKVPAQLWVTSLKPEIGALFGDARMFHVEQGGVRRR